MQNINVAKSIDMDLINPLKRLLLIFLMSAITYLLSGAGSLYANDDAWQALKSGGHFALLRHALAPGTGDPADFDLEDCSTQRNLSGEGRNQAVQIGEVFREEGIEEVSVYSSQWCRCMETAKLLGFAPVAELPVLNSFFRKFEREAPQTQMLADWLANEDLEKPLLLVTHQVNITALTNVYPASGEIIIVRQAKPGEFEVVGRIKTELKMD